MYFPAFLFIADLFLWWLVEDVDERFNELSLTIGLIMLAFVVLIFALHESYLLLRSDDPDDD